MLSLVNLVMLIEQVIKCDFYIFYYSVSHATCVKILKFTLNFKSLVQYMLRHIRSSSGASKLTLETTALLWLNTTPNFTPFYAPMCCTFVLLGDSSYLTCAAITQMLSISILKHLMMNISVKTCSAPVI
jgi:hypothetical protein